MRYQIEDYERYAGKGYAQKIFKLAKPLNESHIVHLNSTYYGGGVAEILSSLIMLLNDAKVTAGWRLLKGSEDFFAVTKKLHHALQGQETHLSKQEKEVYVDTNQINSVFTHLHHHDLVFVHDPQPLPIISFYKKKCPWIWRCHVDISKPHVPTWNYLSKFVNRYDRAVFSANQFRRKLEIPQNVIAPAIDPLSQKNIEIDDTTIERNLAKFDIPMDKPIIAQVSRFDRWKDPWGVIDAYHLIKKKVDCRLVMLGSMAGDDPEGAKIYDGIVEKAAGDDDIHIVSYQSDILVNSLQRAAKVIIQNSIKEGFGLTVTEALWKGTPVVTRRVGGIPLQLKDGYNGYFANQLHDFASKTVKILKNPKLGKKLGANGKAHVRENFLITRLLEDHIRLYRQAIGVK